MQRMADIVNVWACATL